MPKHQSTDLTPAQAYALSEAARHAYLRGWTGELRHRWEPRMLHHAPVGTIRALERKGLVERIHEERGVRAVLTAQGKKAADLALEKRGFTGSLHPREQFKREEEKRQLDAKAAEDQRERVADMLSGFFLYNTDWQGKTTKTNFSKNIRKGVVPYITNLDQLEALCNFLAKEKSA